jgi:hypothetical protein
MWPSPPLQGAIGYGRSGLLTLQQSTQIPRDYWRPAMALGASPKNKKPTFGFLTEVGCLRCESSIPYREIPPHGGALLRQQQVQNLRWPE